MAYEIVQDPETEFNDVMRLELGWNDVAKGLTKVLFGYAMLFFGTVVGFGLVVLSMYNVLSDEAVKAHAKPSNASLWQLYSGLGILSVIGLISFSIIVGGQFKCLLHAPERHGARWFMFACIACLFLSPAFQTASGIASSQTISELKQNPGRLRDVQLNPLGQWLQLIGFVLSMLYPLCFTLFLRSIGICLRLTSLVAFVNIFVALGAGLVGATVFTLVQLPRGTMSLPPMQAVVFGAAWLALLVVYVGLILYTRVSIGVVAGRVKSPLEV